MVFGQLPHDIPKVGPDSQQLTEQASILAVVVRRQRRAERHAAHHQPATARRGVKIGLQVVQLLSKTGMRLAELTAPCQCPAGILTGDQCGPLQFCASMPGAVRHRHAAPPQDVTTAPDVMRPRAWQHDRMRCVRTPEDRFAGLPGFSYAPRYADAGGVRLAWVEAGPGDAEPVLLLHGEPSWSFLYRTVMAVLADAGLRAIAVDLAGFGRSDKPASIDDHSYARHVEWIRALAFDRLDLSGVTLVGQDWGGLIGLRLAAEHPGRFARIVAANTGLPTGDQPMPDVWLRFREVVRTTASLSVSRLVQSGCQTTLSAPVLAAYDAPFPDETYMAGVRAMPGLVPTSPDDPASDANRAAWRQLSAWDKPFLVAFSDRDPITGAMAPVLQRAVPGTAGIEHPVITGAGHFLQEDAGEQFGIIIADFIRSHPARR
jgi:haloalkane dehalogenase